MSGMIRYPHAERDPRRVWLDDQYCERLTRKEFEAVRALLGAVSYVAHADEDLKDSKVMDKIPYGRIRMKMLRGAIRAIADDVCGCMSRKQCQQMRGTMLDFEMRMVPKLSPMSQNVIFERRIAEQLLDAAREKCLGCVEDAESCRSCALYQVLEATTPLEDYGGFICPYADKRFA